MGMSASQINLLRWMNEKSNNQRKMLSLSLQRTSLARDIQKLSDEYQQAVSAKKLQWSAGAANYVDLNYSTLTNPSELNANNVYLISDTSGKIVVNKNDEKYAKMISEDGTPADWEESKYEVLSRVVGVSEEDLRNYDGYYLAYLDNQDALYRLEEAEPTNRSSFTVQNASSITKLLEKFGSSNGISDWAAAYSSGQTVSKDNVTSVINAMKTSLSKYFMENSAKFEQACDSAAEWGVENDVTVKDLVDRILGNYKGFGGAYASVEYADANGNTYPVWYDVDSAAYTEYKQKHDAWEAEHAQAKEAMDDSLKKYNELFPADIENEIDFYDKKFSAIAKNGWKLYSEVSNPEYLNEMLQNNRFMITTVDKQLVNNGNGDYSYNYSFDSDIALNCNKIVSVSDQETRDAALVAYTHKKELLEEKETRIDTWMETLQTRNAAIQQMLQSIEKTERENGERTFNIFT